MEYFYAAKGIPITNSISCAVDRQSAMIDCQHSFIANLKNTVPGIFTVYCVIQLQNLVA